MYKYTKEISVAHSQDIGLYSFDSTLPRSLSFQEPSIQGMWHRRGTLVSE